MLKTTAPVRQTTNEEEVIITQACLWILPTLNVWGYSEDVSSFSSRNLLLNLLFNSITKTITTPRRAQRLYRRLKVSPRVLITTLDLPCDFEIAYGSLQVKTNIFCRTTTQSDTYTNNPKWELPDKFKHIMINYLTVYEIHCWTTTRNIYGII